MRSISIKAALLICAVAMASPARAGVVLVASKIGTGSTGITTAGADTTGSCTTGQVAVAVVQTAGKTPNAFFDSTGATWTASNPAAGVADHGSIALYKRVIDASHQIAANSTTFTVTNSPGGSDQIIYVYCVTDGQSTPTSADNAVDAGQGLTKAQIVTSPTTATSYQIAGIATFQGQPVVTSGGGWTQLDSVEGSGLHGFATAWRQAAGSSTLSWSDSGVFSYNVVGWTEVSTTPPPPAPTGNHNLSTMGIGG